MTTTYLAVDFGGGSGRVIAGSLSADGALTLREIHRFANGAVERDGHLYWDFGMLCSEMLAGLAKAAEECENIVSIGVDTWGVDFGFVNAEGQIEPDVYCYRDTAWESMVDVAANEAGASELYAQSGLQPLAINSMYRLMWMQREGKSFAGKRLLFMPDLFNYALCGSVANEYTIASTSGLVHAHSRQWNTDLMRQLNLPTDIWSQIVMPGNELGTITQEVAQRTGLNGDVKVVTVGSHDTASAVNAISYSPGTAFLSSGTWSLLGIPLAQPVTTPEAQSSGYANEGGCNGILFLQNITGLWILQQLVEQWRKKGLTSSYPELIALAREASIDTVVDVDNPAFARQGNMEQTIADYCRENGLIPPASQGEAVLLVLRSLAARYARGIEQLTRVTKKPVTRLHIIGGGSRNDLLNSLTAEATGLQVTSGPAEATAIGNILTQIKASSQSSPSRIIES